MRGRSLVASIALAAGLVFCVSAPLQFAATTAWFIYGLGPRYQATTVFDPTSDILVVFAGQHAQGAAGVNFNDTWWVLNVASAACLPPCNLQWSEPTLSGKSPSPRFGHTAIYDSVNTRMTVFGGATGLISPFQPCENDVNVLENATGVSGSPTWTTLTPTGSPPTARYSHTAVYDSTNNVMIVFGGNNCGSSYFNDVWTLSDANGLSGTPTWSQLHPTGTPPSARSLCSAIYDETNNRMVVFGGTNGTSLFGDVWVLTNANGLGGTPAWTQLSPSGTPPVARSGHTAVYDQADNLMIVYGGTAAGTVGESDTWVLSNANGLNGTPAWSLAYPAGGNSPERSLHDAVYDASTNQMFIFGGVQIGTTTQVPTTDVFVLNKANGL